MTAISRYIEQLLESSAEKPLWNQEKIRQNKKGSWNYIDGCMMTAFMDLYEMTGDSRYLTFVKDFIDSFVNADGTIRSYDSEEFNLDHINEGRVLFRLYDIFGEKRYKKALDLLCEQLIYQPRTGEGNFWHKKIYPHQVWLDGLYMAQPFYLEYGIRFNDRKNYNDILNQFRNVQRLMKDADTGLYYHGYDSSRSQPWCDPKTGCSSQFWLRSLGWFYMALVDMLDLLKPWDGCLYSTVKEIFTDLTEALLRYQDRDTGMWFQIIDKKERKPNYPETSGSAILAYALFKAVKLGVLPQSYRIRAEQAFKGICTRYLHDRDGVLTLGGICLVAGLGGPDQRDGSFDYYMSEPVVENEAKGIAPFLLAYIHSFR